MRTVRGLLFREICGAVGFVALAFLSLFFFIDFVDELDEAGRTPGRGALTAAGLAALELPGHLYELLPIAVLIGTIYTLARMAQSSEWTILRTGGLGPGRALWLLAGLALGFGVLTVLVGDTLAPAAERWRVAWKAAGAGLPALGPAAAGTTTLSGAGAWLRERRPTPQGERGVNIHVAGTGAGGTLEGIRLFEFDAAGRLASRTTAARGRVEADGTWRLQGVVIDRWPEAGATGDPRVTTERLATLAWPSSLSAGVVAAAVLPVATMNTWQLWQYGRHLDAQAQAAVPTEIRFWRRAVYPFSAFVMVALALPFAYLNARGGGIPLKVFAGILLGITFVLMNNLAGHVGTLGNWTPWVAAAAPSGLFLLLSLAAFGWLVRHR
jgi:lipopolysaccharide export system permease protein